MKRENVLIIVFIALTLGFFACQKSSLDPADQGPSTLGVKIQALNRNYSLPVNNNTKSATTETSTLSWDTVQMVVSSVTVKADLKSLISHKDSIEIVYKWTGPQVTDLLDSTISFGNFILQPGFYDEIEISVKGLEEDANNMPVFYMHGTYTNGDATTIPVKVEVNDDIVFKTEKDSVEVTEDNIDITSYIQIYLDELMAEVSPSALDNARLTEGIILISKESNRDIYKTMLRNLVKDHRCKYKYKYKKKYKHEDDKKKKNKDDD